MEQSLNNLLEMQEMTDIISYVILIQMKKSIHHLLVNVVVMRYRQIQQNNH